MDSYFGHAALVTPFGAFFVAGALVNWWLARRNAAAMSMHPSHIDLAMPLALVGGIAGGTLLAFLPPQDQQLAGAALTVDFRLRLYGIVTSGAIVLFAYSRFAGLGFRRLLDAFALPTLAAVAVHRLGCFFAGCCWGDLSIAAGIPDGPVGRQMLTLPWLAGDWVSWAVQYPPGTFAYRQQLAAGLIGPGAAASLPVHPVQLYEAGLLVVGSLLLRRQPVGSLPPGSVAAAATLVYVLVRFPLEFLRADGAIVVSGLTLVQLQSILLAVIAALAAWYTLRHPAIER